MPYQGSDSGSGFIQRSILTNSNGRELESDLAPNSTVPILITIPFDHHEIHESEFYHASHTVNLANGLTRDVAIVAPNNSARVHFAWSVGCESESHFQFWAEATIAGGTAITSYNRNRNSSNTAKALVYTHPTVNVTGVMLDEEHFGSGKAVGGARQEMNEWILKQGKTYILRFKNETANDNYLSFGLDWYEHPPS